MSEKHPFNEYLLALNEYKQGKIQESTDRITRAIGGDRTTPEILSSIDKIFEMDTDVHNMVIDLITRETKLDERNIMPSS